MKIYDISQEIFTGKVYPGDREPSVIEERRMSRGDLYNLSSFVMGAHNGTHIDAPFHFMPRGDTIERIPLEKTVGECYVSVQTEPIDAEKAQEILCAAEGISPACARRLLIKGRGEVTPAAARLFAASGLLLIGVEGQSIAPESAPMEVHKILLAERVVLLEGIRLAAVREGSYFLSAAPLSLGGFDGAPCRAFLIEK